MTHLIINYRPSVDSPTEYVAQSLLNAFATRKLLDKSVLTDRIVYVFGDPLDVSSKAV